MGWNPIFHMHDVRKMADIAMKVMVNRQLNGVKEVPMVMEKVM